MSVTIPKIFISYSWSSSDRVKELAERLINDGVDVIIDIGDLKEGQDKYAFMERCVTDDSITKVLMICDKKYADKANKREGGVGDETIVISPEIYGKVKQEKFVPVIFERDEDGNEYVPAYLKSRIYIDFSNDDRFEENYDKLLRNLYSKPEWKKPALGKMPEYLNEETVSLTPIRAAIKQLQANAGKNGKKEQFLLRKGNDEIIKALIELKPDDSTSDDEYDVQLLKQIDSAKPVRDLFLDYAEQLVTDGYSAGTIFGDFFEQAYNALYSVEGRNYYRDAEFEYGLFIVWEMFIGATAIMLHYESYDELRTMLYRTYFLNESPVTKNQRARTFVTFRVIPRYIDEVVKQKQQSNLITFSGDMAVKREKLPLIRKQTIANADIVLYQLSEVFDLLKDEQWLWFPKTYIYLGNGFMSSRQEIWSKMVSKRHCEKLFPLFNVSTIKQLTEVIQRNKPDREMGYRNGFSSCAPTITYSIKLEDIATLP